MNSERHARQGQGPKQKDVTVSEERTPQTVSPSPHVRIAEGGFEDLVNSISSRPYLKLALLTIGHRDPRPALEDIAAMPLEKRYAWRVVSALKRAFGDFDSVSAKADVATLLPQDLQKVRSLLRLRPKQFCIFLSVLLGKEAMEQVVTEAINVGKES